MYPRFRQFIRAISINWISKGGVILATSSFTIFIILEIARLLGIITGAFIGLITYLLLPLLFIIGLLLIPAGWRRYQKTTGNTIREILKERFEQDDTRATPFGSRIFQMVAGLTVVNLLFVGGAGLRMFKFMDEPRFCGTACHSVMNPEWTTYQDSPHARVKCVECHVGEGMGALIDSKLNGAWQMISVTFDLLERPIPTPVHQLRPTRETCEKCHWPDKFYGRRLKTISTFGTDENSTRQYTTLSLKIDSATGRQGGIHWHIAAENEVRYASVDDKRERIIWVEVYQADGSCKRYTDPDLAQSTAKNNNVRILDCVDCHNRATHIYEYAARSIDKRIHSGLMNRGVPYLKQEALHTISKNYPDREAAFRGIANHIRGFYRRHYPEEAGQMLPAIDSVVGILQAIYARNIHPEMKITWGSYPDHIGHRGDGGCFRCHNSQLVDKDGKHISFDCTLCHSLLAYDSDEPFKFLQRADPDDRENSIHEYLKREFLNSYAE